jgi:hypothetical protein
VLRVEQVKRQTASAPNRLIGSHISVKNRSAILALPPSGQSFARVKHDVKARRDRDVVAKSVGDLAEVGTFKGALAYHHMTAKINAHRSLILKKNELSFR